ncbi:bactofilin [Paenibacillus montanisoli]|uniref:Bactofilin n=1 Tax=Paenibacillus montanisoli TaxID=2081970 RepID=A0A328TVZ4_9BACL|nr:bactofilin [Paenibacillus montanisoli]RAP73832.1 bactofilin [Paenibacillus montanisoli]
MATGVSRKVKITGSGSTSGGTFESVHVIGEGQVLGSLESESVKSMGTINVSGSVKVGQYRQIGEATIRGDMQGIHLNVMGQLDIKGSIRCRTMKLRGQIDVHGECEADEFDARGGFHIHGLLSANEVEVRTWGPCRAKEIGGGRINVRQSKWGGLKQWFSGTPPMELTCELVEGDNIYLEHTIADVVRGTSVTIGPGCRIGLVEYRKTLKVSKDAKVTQQVKL